MEKEISAEKNIKKNPVNVTIGENNLSKIEFIFGSASAGDNYRVEFEDDARVITKSNDTFDVIYSRKTITNEPFTFYVEFTATIRVNDLKQLSDNNETLEEFGNRKKMDIVEKLVLPSRASLIIGNITRECGGAFITIPIYYKKK